MDGEHSKGSARGAWAAAVVGLALLGSAAATEVFESTGDQGETVYSDRPSPGATPTELRPLPTVELPRAPYRPEGPDRHEDPAAHRRDGATRGYPSFEIVRPRSDEAIRSDGGTVEVALRIETLAPGHRLDLVLDGEPVITDLAAASVLLHDVPRGTHSLQAVVTGARGARIAATAPVLFHVLRSSVLAPRGPQVPGGAPSIPGFDVGPRPGPQGRLLRRSRERHPDRHPDRYRNAHRDRFDDRFRAGDDARPPGDERRERPSFRANVPTPE
jgi:hypothetical protein